MSQFEPIYLYDSDEEQESKRPRVYDLNAEFQGAFKGLPGPLQDLIVDFACGEGASQVIPQLVTSLRKFDLFVSYFDANAKRFEADFIYQLRKGVFKQTDGRMVRVLQVRDRIRNLAFPIYKMLTSLIHFGRSTEIWNELNSDFVISLMRLPGWTQLNNFQCPFDSHGLHLFYEKFHNCFICHH